MGNGVEMGEIGMLWCVGPSYGVRTVQLCGVCGDVLCVGRDHSVPLH